MGPRSHKWAWSLPERGRWELELLSIRLQDNQLAGKAPPRLSKRGELSKELAMATVPAATTMRTAAAVGAAPAMGAARAPM